jgi:ATP dependent DNA ligase C terminal region
MRPPHKRRNEEEEARDPKAGASNNQLQLTGNSFDPRTGLDGGGTADLRKRLTPLIRKTQPYTKRIAHKGIWVEPELLAEIEYRAKSAGGKVRHPFFRGLRKDL